MASGQRQLVLFVRRVDGSYGRSNHLPKLPQRDLDHQDPNLELERRTRENLGLPRSIPVAGLRASCERALAIGDFASWSQLAIACGYMKDEKVGDVIRLKRLLGLAKSTGKGAQQRRIHLKTAYIIIKALDLPPIDFGL